MGKDMTTENCIGLPLVSVIIPTFNRSGYVIEAIRSVILQDYPPERFEIIVVDNASTDDTSLRIRQFAKDLHKKYNFKYIIERRKGLSFTRNSGAAHADGSIFLFTDDDAIFDQNWISEIVNVYLQHPEVGAVGSKILIKWDREPDPWINKYEGLLGRLDWEKNVVVGHDIELFGGSLSVRRDIFYRVGGFNPGQIGEYLIGDCDTGICRKLSNEGVMIGWTPLTTVWHLQSVEKNGTLKDMKRRFVNCGISDAYGASFYNWDTKRMAKDFIGKTRNVSRGFITVLRTRDIHELHRYAVLDLSKYFYYIKYLCLYKFHRKLRKTIGEKLWEFGSDYHPPPIDYHTSVS